MKDKLKATISYGGILTEEELNYVLPFYEKLILNPGDEFLSIGQISNRVGFVDQGILRVYFETEKGDEVTKYFIRPNQFGVDLESYYDNRPTQYAMQAVIPTTVYYLTRNTWNQLAEKIPRLFMLMKTLTEVTLLNKIKDNEFLIYGTAKEKYLEFMKRYPDLALHVPLQHIASYLQITPQSLSRIRKNI